MIEIQVNKKSDPVEVTVKGNLVFSTVEELREQLLKATPRKGALRLVLAEIQEFDLPGVQLLYALCRSGETGQVRTEIVLGESARRIDKMLRFAGLAPISCARP